ncbi:MAG: phosphotransferase [Coriobacteriales bacterium]|nr:phosphotransferase [Coriobacteriales bacterium]
MATGNRVEMAIEEMKHYTPSTPANMRKLGLDLSATAASLATISATSQEQYYYKIISEILRNNYNIGELLDVYQIFGGYVNTTFGIYVLKDGHKETWIVRKYRKGKTLDALTFEHRLLRHAKAHGNQYVAAPIDTLDGKTYVVQTIDFPGEHDEFFFAVFNYIDGRQIYDWMPNWAVDSLKDITVESAAEVLSQFHSSTFDFDPQGQRGDNILGTNEDMHVNDLIADLPRRLREYRVYYAEHGLDNKFTEYMDTYQSKYDEWCALATIPAEAYQQMFMCPCHLDFHAGNFKYWEDESISGSFDYDMAMVDSRLFDITLGMHYTLASWGLANSGEIKLHRVEQFVRAYNQNCLSIGRIPPLNEIEKQYFFEAMLQAPIYVYGWAQGSVYADMSAHQYEYLFYCQHFSDSCLWLIEHETEIRELAARL